MNRRVTPGVCTARLVLLTMTAIFSLSGLASAQLPSGWSSRDIGSVGASGSSSASGSSFTVRGAGADIWGSADGFQFAYRTMKGDGEVIARVSSIDWLHAWSKAGVMMRDSLNAGARHVFMLSSSGNGNAFQRRSSSSGSSYNTDANGSPGSFVRITRTGNNFDAYESWDGYNWNWVGSECHRPSTWAWPSPATISGPSRPRA